MLAASQSRHYACLLPSKLYFIIFIYLLSSHGRSCGDASSELDTSVPPALRFTELTNYPTYFNILAFVSAAAAYAHSYLCRLKLLPYARQLHGYFILLERTISVLICNDFIIIFNFTHIHLIAIKS